MSQFTRFSAIAVLVLCGLAGGRARAGLVLLASPADLGPSDVATDPYAGANGTIYPTPYTASAGGNSLEFRAAGGAVKLVIADAFTDFPAGTRLLGTFSTSGATGPLTVSFAAPVAEFGLSVQNAGIRTEQFAFTAFDGPDALGTFTTPVVDNSSSTGAALFLGARATGGDLITSFVITDLSTSFTNNFLAGPVTIGAPVAAVPEPSTLASTAAGGLIGAGLYWRRSRRRRPAA